MDGNSSEEKPPRVRRKMKTAAQLEALERTYKIDTYPPESLRAELSEQLGLSDRQLQMWFCHRRLKDRKTTINTNPTPRMRKGEALPATAAPLSTSAPVVAGGDDQLSGSGSGSGSGSSPYRHLQHRVPRIGVSVPRINHGRYYEPPPQSLVEVRAIEYVEAQLGQPLREDGPAFGIQFDPLPPGAFGAPIVPSEAAQKQPGRAYEANSYERPDVKAMKGHGRAVHEYQFLPEQPSVQSDAYERLAQPHYYGSPPNGLSTRTHVLPTGRSYMHGGEEVPSHGLKGQIPSVSLTSNQRKHAHHVPSTSEGFDGITRKAPYTSMPVESPFSSPTGGLDVGLVPPERPSMHDEDVVRLERKRKVALSEVHEKRTKKELEKQDMMRRKREEQMRKEMERLDRERRKEEERMLREKQREVEKYEREQRREMERQEKVQLKESIRVERLKQKEALRREKDAAKQKAANDRAAARRIAKESTELIEDERLELMEIAASAKRLPSILSLDSEMLQNLDSCRELLREFPPNTVQLKRPFAIQPWTDSEENVGNLLMVWRFILTFADVFGLWPFTLDEFVQAFHDYDPRIMGEIHIALLKIIIKDIEDAARTPSTGLGLNQSATVNPGGGHPHIVQGAYTWGFEIRSWQQHLGPLTWLEILRQFALSAGFGPTLKKRDILYDYSEGNDGMTIISNLRNGAAVENAVAIMQERGYSNPRRSRHRLTPGTVKFAAFHILSLEGSQGLNILEVADRIQKSGLRDLTTSKTPEASISAALSRDTKLFERVAPSTYCVRTPYRKDAADAEAIISVAREKIRAFKSGFVDGVEADEVEKDDDSESDTAEDPEVDDLGAELVTHKGVEFSLEVKRTREDVSMGNGMEPLCDGVIEGLQNEFGNTGDTFPLSCIEELAAASASVDECDNLGSQDEVFNTKQEDNDVDENSPCKPWVQGLMEGDYSDLSVEERLDALVALIGVAIEGNSVRIVLEERLEAANALKKQMLAEAQLDKRRLKEEHVMRSVGENRRSPLLADEQKGSDAGFDTAVPQEQLPDAVEDRKAYPDSPLNKNTVNVDYSAGPDNTVLQQSYAAAERSRAQLKSYIGHKAEGVYVYRSLPLGMDRRRNRYWQFIASASCNDPGSGRIFVELHNGDWRVMDSEETFDALLASLDVRGIRESHLHSLLQRIEALFKESVKGKRLANNIATPKEVDEQTEFSVVASHLESSEDNSNKTNCASNSNVPETLLSFQIESGRNNIEIKNIVRRYKEIEEWMWKECLMNSALRAKKYGKKRCEQLLGVCDCCHDLFFFEDQHCPTCHHTFSASDMNINFSDHMARCDEMLKLDPVWKMKCLDSLAPVRIRLLKALLVLLEVSVPTEALQPKWTDGYRRSWATQLHMSSSADDLLQALTALEGAIKDLLSPNFQTTNDIVASSKPSKLSGSAVPVFNLRNVPVLPWIPQTTAAVALRLMELDSAVFYTLDQKEEFRKAGDVSNMASTFTISLGNLDGNCLGRSSRSKGGRRGGSQSHSEKLGRVGGWNKRGRGGGGRRSTKQKPGKKKAGKGISRSALFENSPSLLGREEDEEAAQMQVGIGNVSKYEDNGQAYGNDKYGNMVEELGVYGGSVKSSEGDEDEDVDVGGYKQVDYDGAYEQAADVDGESESDQDVDVEGYLNVESGDEYEEEGNGNQNRNKKDDSVSSEYSD